MDVATYIHVCMHLVQVPDPGCQELTLYSKVPNLLTEEVDTDGPYGPTEAWLFLYRDYSHKVKTPQLGALEL